MYFSDKTGEVNFDNSKPGTSKEAQSSSFDNETLCPVVLRSTSLENLPGFDVDSGQTWIYPINYPIRRYQYDISKSALFSNVLVSLPTGKIYLNYIYLFQLLSNFKMLI